mmetsp:Transcript_142/g.431  ORF Transcript_142/g.431 Transcript_142/m.431 type:complete len:293 (+) Transcript_142:125-1003(+)
MVTDRAERDDGVAGSDASGRPETSAKDPEHKEGEEPVRKGAAEPSHDRLQGQQQGGHRGERAAVRAAQDRVLERRGADDGRAERERNLWRSCVHSPREHRRRAAVSEGSDLECGLPRVAAHDDLRREKLQASHHEASGAEEGNVGGDCPSDAALDVPESLQLPPRQVLHLPTPAAQGGAAGRVQRSGAREGLICEHLHRHRPWRPGTVLDGHEVCDLSRRGRHPQVRSGDGVHNELTTYGDRLTHGILQPRGRDVCTAVLAEAQAPVCGTARGRRPHVFDRPEACDAAQFST